MAYNLYQVQLAKAWSQRIDKENAQAEQFWTKQAERPLLSYTARHLPGERSVAGSSKASSSAAPTGYTSKTSYLKTRLDALEADLMKEQEHRKRVEADLEMIRTGSLSSTYSSGVSQPHLEQARRPSEEKGVCAESKGIQGWGFFRLLLQNVNAPLKRPSSEQAGDRHSNT